MAAAPTFSSAPSSLAPSLLSMINKVVVPPSTPSRTQNGSPQALTEHTDTHHLPWTDKAINNFVQEWYPLTVDVVNRELHAKQAARTASAATAATRKSARQASRPARANMPWRTLMRRKIVACGEDRDPDDASNCSSSKIRHRTVGEVEVQVYRKVLPRAAINLLMNGEQHLTKITTSSTSSRSMSSSNRIARNPWPGVNFLIQTLFESEHATQVKHPYIAEISSRCDSGGPPQRLDLLLTSSGVQCLLTPTAILGVEAIIFSLKEALQFAGKVQWDTHLVLVLPGAPEQKFHVDSSRSWFYFTLIFPLSKDPPKAGKTEFWDKKDQPVVPVERGDVLVFDGRRKHRGSANATSKHVRAFLYIAVYSGTDWN